MWEFFVSFVNFDQQTRLATFYLILLNFTLFNFVMWELLINQSQLSIQISSLEIHSFKWSWCTWECNNWYRLWKSIHYVRINILLRKKAPSWLFSSQIKPIAHDNFSVCFLDTKSFYHCLILSFCWSRIISVTACYMSLRLLNLWS